MHGILLATMQVGTNSIMKPRGQGIIFSIKYKGWKSGIASGQLKMLFEEVKELTYRFQHQNQLIKLAFWQYVRVTSFRSRCIMILKASQDHHLR
jgi:hypothetical protein